MDAMVMEPTTRQLIVLDSTGDTKTVWDTEKPEEVEVARSTFNTLKKKGYLAYSVNRKGDRGEVLREFDPNAGTLIMAPPTVGG